MLSICEDGSYILDCQHCGNRTKMEMISDFSQETKHYDNSQYEIGTSFIKWKLYLCPVCKKPTLKKDYEDNINYDKFSEILYPAKSFNKRGVPGTIIDAYEVAIKARHIDESICLLSLRRTLERICKDKGYIYGTLNDKINKMVTDNLLPGVLKDMSGIIRELGNEAAHGDDVEHTEKDVEDLIDFTQYIIDYIYVLPNKLEQIQKRIDVRSSNKSL